MCYTVTYVDRFEPGNLFKFDLVLKTSKIIDTQFFSLVSSYLSSSF